MDEEDKYAEEGIKDDEEILKCDCRVRYGQKSECPCQTHDRQKNSDGFDTMPDDIENDNSRIEQMCRKHY